VIIDSEEFVVEKVLNSLTSLAELGLLTKVNLRDLNLRLAGFLCHPNVWIRYGKFIFSLLLFILFVFILLPHTMPHTMLV